MEQILNQGKELVATFGINVITALAIFLVGRWAAKFIRMVSVNIMTRAKVDQMLVSFLSHLIYAALLALVTIAALGQLGIQTTSFVAILGAAGLAVGLALQGSLSNFAAGVLIIIFRPFKVGDYIEGGGAAGTVEEMQIFTTQLVTPDNKTIIIPNAKLTNDKIVNYSAKENRRIDMTVGVAYSDDIAKVKRVLDEILAQEPRVLKNPSPKVALQEFGPGNVKFMVRPWVKAADHWEVSCALNEAVKRRFDEDGITMAL